MKVLLPLLLLLASSMMIIHMYGTTKVTHTEEPFEEEVTLEELEQGSLVFKADVNCQIGSRYIMGVGCEESIFNNAHLVKNQVQARPIKRTEIKHFKVTSSSEVNTMTSHKASIEGGGWGVKVKAGLDMLNKKFDTVNTVSVDLTDYRQHQYKYVSATVFEMDEDLANEIDDPEYFFEKYGYYFVIGYTTGSTFDGILNYKSTSSEVLKDISTNVGISYGYGPFSVGGNYAYSNMKNTKNGDASYDSQLNVTGCNNNIWDKNDIAGSHDLYQNTINEEQMMSVAVTKWDSIKVIRDAIRELKDDSAKAALREFAKVQPSFLKRISEAFIMYSFIQTTLSQHIISLGATLSAQNLKILRDMKMDIDKRIDRLQDMKYIGDVQKLNANKYTDDLIEYEFKIVDVQVKLKAMTARQD